MPAEEETEQTADERGSLAPLRTYEGDVQKLLKKGGVSQASIALKEAEKQREEAARSKEASPGLLSRASFSSAFRKAPRARLALYGTLIAAAAAAALFGLFVSLTRRAPETLEPAEAPRVQGAGGNAREIVVTTTSRSTFLRRFGEETAATEARIREIVRFILLEETALGRKPLSFADLLLILESNAPPALLRALAPELAIGLHGFRGGQLFIAVPVSSFDHAFEGMLRWEPTLLRELGPLFGVHPQALRGSATTTEGFEAGRLVFKDTVVINRDVRAVFNDSEEAVFLYAFADKKLLVITTNEETLKAAIAHLERGTPFPAGK